MKKYLLLGAGYSARAFAALVAGKADIAGTTRSPQKAEALREAGIAAILFDGTAISPELSEALRRTTHLVVSAAPGPTGPSSPAGPSPRKHGEKEAVRNASASSFSPSAGRRSRQGDEGQAVRITERQSSKPKSGDPFLTALTEPLREAMPALHWVGYLSTVGVYGDHQGAWVDESSKYRPRPGRSAERLEAENAWLAAGETAGVPVAVLRLSGIYGPGRNALVNLAGGTARRIVKPGQIFNRIHVADIAGALAHLAERNLGGVFNVSDDEPSPPQEVVDYAARLMGVAPPPEVAYDEAEMTPMARSFWGETKRVSNARIRATGYDFAYPDYRAALDAMWHDGSWRD